MHISSSVEDVQLPVVNDVREDDEAIWQSPALEDTYSQELVMLRVKELKVHPPDTAIIRYLDYIPDIPLTIAVISEENVVGHRPELISPIGRVLVKSMSPLGCLVTYRHLAVHNSGSSNNANTLVLSADSVNLKLGSSFGWRQGSMLVTTRSGCFLRAIRQLTFKWEPGIILVSFHMSNYLYVATKVTTITMIASKTMQFDRVRRPQLVVPKAADGYTYILLPWVSRFVLDPSGHATYCVIIGVISSFDKPVKCRSLVAWSFHGCYAGSEGSAVAQQKIDRVRFYAVWVKTSDSFVDIVDDWRHVFVECVFGLMNSTSGGLSELVVAATAHLRVDKAVDYHIIAQATTLSSVDGLRTAAFCEVIVDSIGDIVPCISVSCILCYDPSTRLYYMFRRFLGMLFVRMYYLCYMTVVGARLFDPGIGHTECLLFWPYDLPVKVAYNRMAVRVRLFGNDRIRDSNIANMTKYMDGQFLRRHQLASAESVTPWGCSTKIVRISCIVPYLLELQYYDCCVLLRILKLVTCYSDEHSAVLPEIVAAIPCDKEQKTSGPSAYNLCFHSCIVYLLRNNPCIVDYMFPSATPPVFDPGILPMLHKLLHFRSHYVSQMLARLGSRGTILHNQNAVGTWQLRHMFIHLQKCQLGLLSKPLFLLLISWDLADSFVRKGYMFPATVGQFLWVPLLIFHSCKGVLKMISNHIQEGLVEVQAMDTYVYALEVQPSIICSFSNVGHFLFYGQADPLSLLEYVLLVYSVHPRVTSHSKKISAGMFGWDKSGVLLACGWFLFQPSARVDDNHRGSSIFTWHCILVVLATSSGHSFFMILRVSSNFYPAHGLTFWRLLLYELILEKVLPANMLSYIFIAAWFSEFLDLGINSFAINTWISSYTDRLWKMLPIFSLTNAHSKVVFFANSRLHDNSWVSSGNISYQRHTYFTIVQNIHYSQQTTWCFDPGIVWMPKILDSEDLPSPLGSVLHIFLLLALSWSLDTVCVQQDTMVHSLWRIAWVSVNDFYGSIESFHSLGNMLVVRWCIAWTWVFFWVSMTLTRISVAPTLWKISWVFDVTQQPSLP